MNSGANGMGGQGEGQGNLAGANNTQTTPAVRISMKLGFVPLASLRPAEASLAVASHLAAMPALHLQTPVQVVMQGRTAILSGVVETEHDRDLAERVVRLEGAVDKVQNQLVVANAAAPQQVLSKPVERIAMADNSRVAIDTAVDDSAPVVTSAPPSSFPPSSVLFGKVPPPPAPGAD